MSIYAMQVMTGAEETVINRLKSYHFNYNHFFPKRSMKIRKSGKTLSQDLPLFTGYLFVEADQIDPQYLWFCKHTQGFIRFLKSNEEPRPLENRDVEIVSNFIRNKGISKVTFESGKIVVLEGCLKGLEGQIKSVDKRKGRAKVALDLYSDTFLIDLAFEVMGAA